MKAYKVIYLIPLAGVLILSGCAVRTYQATRDRVDQDLSSGNRGYLMGNAPVGDERERKATRTTQVVEVELRSPIKFGRAKKASPVASETAIQEEYISTEENLPETATFQKYTVQKNDTLQKISQKFYGTTKKWHKIFEANQDMLKSPDKIRPGQVINIPEIPGMSSEAAMQEPKENLK